MLPLRLVSLLILLLAVQGWCKPAKSTEVDEPSYYNDDENTPEDETGDDDVSPDEEDSAGTSDEPPQIMSKPVNVYTKSGSTIMLPCLLKNAESFLVTWKKDNELLYSDASPMTTDSKRIVRQPNNTLVIYNASVNDSSNNYECSILVKPVIAITHKVHISAERTSDRPTISPPGKSAKPEIHVTPSEVVEVSAGESVTLGCEIKVDPRPTIKWYHKNEKVSDKVTVSDNHISIKNINRFDAGFYQCLADDKSENPPIAAIKLVVNFAPEVTSRREVVNSGLGVESDLACIVHAHPNATVSWYKGNFEHVSGNPRISMHVKDTMHILKIMHTEVKDFGEYKCVATNNMGRAEKAITLTGTPSQAVYDSKPMQTDASPTLRWRVESYSPIIQYKLQIRRRKGEEQWTFVKPAVTNGKGNRYTVEHPIEGLQPGSYEAIITAENEFGWSEPSLPHAFEGVYASEEAESSKGSASLHGPLAAVVIAFFLVSSSCAFRSL